MSVRYRRISPNEWAYLAAARLFPPFAIQLWIDGDGDLPLTDLRAAVQAAAEVNAGARLVADGRWWVDSRSGPEVGSEAGSLSLDHPLLRKPFDPFRTPPCTVTLFPGKGILFRCSHALMDARGLLFFAEETFRALRGETPRGTSRVFSDFEYLRSFRKRRPWPKGGVRSPLGPPTSNEAFGFEWQARTLPGGVDALAARLQGAIAARASSLGAGAMVRIMVPVALRDDEDRQRTTANLSSPLLLDATDIAGWRDALGRTIAALARGDHLATHPVDGFTAWLPRAALTALQKRVHADAVRRDRYLVTAIVSHVGKVALSSFTSERFRARAARLMPFDAPASALTLVSLEHDHGLELAASAPRAAGGAAALSRMLDELALAIVRPPTVFALFSREVARAPGSLAVSGDVEWTCEELDRRARAWDTRLRAAGVKRGDRVAILAPRSAEVIAAILGTLRRGAAFVPVDIEWPPERIRFVLADCEPACVVAASAHAHLALKVPVLPVEETPVATDDAAPPIEPASDEPAYLMYTSGSTGRPKGVVVGHGSLSNYLRWARDTYIGARERPAAFPLFTSLSFDLTITSLFLPLVSGGEIHVFAQTNPLLTARALLSDPRIDCIKLTPSHLRLLCEIGLERSALRTFIVGGEALPTELARRAHQQCDDELALYNEYGPTEATVGCVVHRFDTRASHGAQVPIGTPIAGTTIELEADGLTTDDPREILISGDCLALGYWRMRDEPPRFIDRNGVRAYRTGDLATRDAGGVLHYHGRLDDQVKIRGHRIELAEIEHALLAQGTLSDAAVIAETSGGNISLTAFVVWRGAPDETALMEGIAKLLPAYMRPSRFVALDALPLTVNGKVDRNALGGRSRSYEDSARADRAGPGGPSAISESESRLRDMLAEILRIPATDLHVDRSLLEQGCDSLSLAILLQRAHAECGRRPNGTLDALVAAMSRAPTLRRLSQLLAGPMSQDAREVAQ